MADVLNERVFLFTTLIKLRFDLSHHCSLFLDFLSLQLIRCRQLLRYYYLGIGNWF